MSSTTSAQVETINDKPKKEHMKQPLTLWVIRKIDQEGFKASIFPVELAPDNGRDEHHTEVLVDLAQGTHKRTTRMSTLSSPPHHFSFKKRETYKLSKLEQARKEVFTQVPKSVSHIKHLEQNKSSNINLRTPNSQTNTLAACATKPKGLG